MKPEKIRTFLVSLAMACLLSFGAMGAMISGLNLPVEDMVRLYLFWAAAALAGCILFSFKWGWIPALAGVTLGLCYLWRVHYLSLPLRALITRLSSIYDSAYHWGVWEFAGVFWRDIPLDLALGVIGCLIGLSAAATMMRNYGLILTLALTLLPLGSTVVVTNTPPDAPYVFMVVLGIIVLSLTATVRRHNPHQGARLAALTALPLAALLGALFAICPQDTYVNRSEEYLSSVVNWWQSATAFSFDSTGLIDQTPVTPNSSATANLSRVGPRNLWGYTVMEAEADYSGVVYLRGQDFDVYDGTSWSAATDRDEHFGGMPDIGTWIYDGEISLRTASTANVLYLPYYPTQEQSLSGGQVENGGGLREYSFGVRHPQNQNLVIHDGPVNAGVNTGRYTNLPASTRRWAVEYLNAHFTTDFLQHSTDAAIAHDIARYVRELVPYDTNTPRMSGEYDDFAQWFLEEAETGYCVHFATATAVLLRAAGIPARYVTGYMFESTANKTVEVTADQAHAWVEYYNEACGVWMVLEPTPPDLEDTETQPPETEPEETEPPTQTPTAPSDRPDDPADPDAPDGPQPGGEEKPAADLTWLWTALKWLLVPVVLWLAVVIQYRIRRGLRRHGRTPNARALTLWQQIELLCRVTRQTPPETLEDLAQKAKFSQHTLTAEELKAFTAWLQTERKKPMPWYRRIVCKYVLAIW